MWGRSSMEVRIDTYAEKLDGTRKMINRAYFVMVGTDENQNPIEVPGLIVEGLTRRSSGRRERSGSSFAGSGRRKASNQDTKRSMLPLRNPSRSSVT